MWRGTTTNFIAALQQNSRLASVFAVVIRVQIYHIREKYRSTILIPEMMDVGYHHGWLIARSILRVIRKQTAPLAAEAIDLFLRAIAQLKYTALGVLSRFGTNAIASRARVQTAWPRSLSINLL
jgi:hypothetical protein